MWSDLVAVVGEDTAPYWELLMPKVYYKDGKPHGVIGYTQEPTLTTVYSMSLNDIFTVGMLRDIIRLYNSSNLCLITDSPDAFEHIKKVLGRYDFAFVKHMEDSGREWMYSFHFWS